MILLTLVLGDQAPGRIGVVDRHRQELDLGATADEFPGELPLARLVVIADVGPGWLARWNVGEDQTHSRLVPGQASRLSQGRCTPDANRAAARQGATGTAAEEPAAIEAATLILHNAQTLVDGHG